MARFLVIAAASGIGQATVKQLKATGHQVFTTARDQSKITPDALLDATDFEAVEPVLAAMAASVVRVGEVGAGNVAKLANQIVVALNIAAMSEAFVLAAKAGVEPDLVYQAIRGGLAGSTVLDAKAPLVMDRKFDPGFRIKLHAKDLNNVMNTAHELHVPLPFTAAVMEVMQAMMADGCGEDDHGSIIRHFEKLAGVTVAR